MSSVKLCPALCHERKPPIIKRNAVTAKEQIFKKRSASQLLFPITRSRLSSALPPSSHRAGKRLNMAKPKLSAPTKYSLVPSPFRARSTLPIPRRRLTPGPASAATASAFADGCQLAARHSSAPPQVILIFRILPPKARIAKQCPNSWRAHARKIQRTIPSLSRYRNMAAAKRAPPLTSNLGALTTAEAQHSTPDSKISHPFSAPNADVDLLRFLSPRIPQLFLPLRPPAPAAHKALSNGHRNF